MNNYRASFSTYDAARAYVSTLQVKWGVSASIEETALGYDVTWRMK